MFWKYLGIVFLATVKFIFSPITAIKTIEHHTWYYTYLAVCLGGLLSASFFYFFSVQIINRNVKRRIKKGKIRKKFNRKNKLIINTKTKIGVVGLALLAASFISIPLGSIVLAKFYRHKKSTIIVLYSAIILSAAFFTGISYYFFN